MTRQAVLTSSIVRWHRKHTGSRQRYSPSVACCRLKILPHIGDMRLGDVKAADLDRLSVTLLVSGGQDASTKQLALAA